MSQEQKPESAEFRTREAQVRGMATSMWDMANSLSEWLDVPMSVHVEYSEEQVAEAEARGAAEQRRKDAEGAEPVAWAYEVLGLGEYSGAGGYGPDEWRETTSKSHPSDASGGFSSEHRNVRPLYTRPANVAALEKALNDIGNEVLEGAEPFLDAVIRILKTVGIDPLNGSEPLDQVADLEDRVKELEGVLVEIAHNKTSDCPNADNRLYQDQVAWAVEWCRRKARAAIREGGEHG